MEIAGFKKCMSQILTNWKLKMESFVSDRHIQIRAYMRDTYGADRKNKAVPYIKHYLDVWHVAKSKSVCVYLFCMSDLVISLAFPYMKEYL